MLTFLKAFGIEKLAKKRDWPRYVTQEPESYENDELEKFFAACDPEEKIFFEFYLMTGFRKKEVAFCTWPDVDLRAGVVRVTAKPEHGFKPKDWEDREVPIPDRLVQSLKAWAKSRNGSEFVFPLRTVQLWLGHKDLESTMRYLKPARGKGVREKVNATFALSAQ